MLSNGRAGFFSGMYFARGMGVKPPATMEEKTVFTIGHSTHTQSQFIDLLMPFHITWLVDVRSGPGSRRYPQFNKDAMEAWLGEAGIGYTHLPALGGRRAAVPGSRNTALKASGFRGYADYMETPEFFQAGEDLERLAMRQVTVFMCSEAAWQNCHRSLLSDWLKHRGWEVVHIGAGGLTEVHAYTPASRIVDGNLTYAGQELGF